MTNWWINIVENLQRTSFSTKLCELDMKSKQTKVKYINYLFYIVAFLVYDLH